MAERINPFTVALIGGDGAGKGTISQLLLEKCPLPLEYIYMGINTESSNVALPTSRWIEKFKKNRGDEGYRPPTDTTHPSQRKKKNPIWSALRLLNRIAEEWYRQWLSLRARQNGKIVLYDRYFTFDFARDPQEPDSLYRKRPWDDRLHRWLLAKCYPEPDLVIFLWAPAEVLFARKGEASLPYLTALMATFEHKGSSHPNFVKVDVRQPVEAVFEAVNSHIVNFHKSIQNKTLENSKTKQ
jgi:thymidylate kinase